MLDPNRRYSHLKLIQLIAGGQQMTKQSTIGAKNDLARVATESRPLPKHVRQAYLRQMQPIIRELHRLLPAYRRCVGQAQYDTGRSDLMRLTACFCDDSLSIFALEALLQNLKWHQQMFATALR